jgi:hypothetical protein
MKKNKKKFHNESKKIDFKENKEMVVKLQKPAENSLKMRPDGLADCLGCNAVGVDAKNHICHTLMEGRPKLTKKFEHFLNIVRENINESLFSKSGTGIVDGHKLRIEYFSDASVSSKYNVVGTIRTVPQNYYVASIYRDGSIKFDDIEANTRDINQDAVTKWYDAQPKRTFESLISSLDELVTDKEYKTPSGMGGAFTVVYKGRDGEGKHVFVNTTNKDFAGAEYTYNDETVLKNIHRLDSSVYNENVGTAKIDLPVGTKVWTIMGPFAGKDRFYGITESEVRYKSPNYVVDVIFYNVETDAPMSGYGEEYAIDYLHRFDGVKMYESRNTNKPYVVHYTHEHMRGSDYGNSPQQLADKMVEMGASEWAVYSNSGGFHSTTQENYLVLWYDRGNNYWSNRAKKDPTLLKKKYSK